MQPTPTLVTVPVDGGTLTCEVHGEGPETLVALPGMGDLRGEYRHLVPLLVAAGRRVVVCDLRGLGDSSPGFTSFTVEDTAADVLSVLDHLGIAQATLVGCSYSGATMALVAARAPARVSRLVLLSPFVRAEVAGGWWMRPTMRLLLAWPWGAWAWASYLRRLFGEKPPADLDAGLAAIRADLGRPGHRRATLAQGLASKAPAAARLGDVRAPAVVVFGGRDADFPDPAAEAAWVAGALGGEARPVVLPGLGHYPHLEDPAQVARLILGTDGGEARLVA